MFRKNKVNLNDGNDALNDVEIPEDLSHLSQNQLLDRVSKFHIFRQSKIWLIMGIVVAVFLTYMGFTHLNSSSHFVVFNFHDDLVELDKANCTGNKVNNINNGGTIVGIGNNFYAASDQNIYFVNLSLSQKHQVISEKAGYLNYSNDRLYFINRDDKTLKVYDTLNDQIVPTKLKAEQLITVGNYIFFLSADDYHTVYQIDEDFLKLKAITQSGCIYFAIEGDWVYFATSQGLYRVPLMGGEVSQVLEGDFLDFNISQKTIYYRDRNKTLKRMKEDGTNQQLLVSGEVDSYVVLDDSICYATSGGVFRYYMESSKTEQLTSENARGLQIIGSWLYYFPENTTEGRFVSLDINSSQITPLYSISEN